MRSGKSSGDSKSGKPAPRTPSRTGGRATSTSAEKPEKQDRSAPKAQPGSVAAKGRPTKRSIKKVTPETLLRRKTVRKGELGEADLIEREDVALRSRKLRADHDAEKRPVGEAKASAYSFPMPKLRPADPRQGPAKIELLQPAGWRNQEYALIDCGDYQKLERFGGHVLQRPEPQAVWRPVKPLAEWREEADAIFEPTGPNSGNWKRLSPLPENWSAKYRSQSIDIQLRLAMTAFKHVGLFPEQAANWQFIAQQVRRLMLGPAESEKPRVLNLFAYTGAASLVAAQAGADVTHVDSIKQVVTWARQSMEMSSIDGIRWAVEDARKFVQRENKRGNTYHGIILDPPAYGLGPDGERWKLEEDLRPLLDGVVGLLEEGGFLVLNTYSLGFSSLILDNLLRAYFAPNKYRVGELVLKAERGPVLPLGVYGWMGEF